MQTENPPNPYRGEIWMINFDPSVGSEYQKVRPAVVVNEDNIGWETLRIVVPLTGWKEDYFKFPWIVRIEPSLRNGLKKVSGADSSQIKSISAKRFERRIGVVTAYQLREIVAAVAICIGFE